MKWFNNLNISRKIYISVFPIILIIFFTIIIIIYNSFSDSNTEDLKRYSLELVNKNRELINKEFNKPYNQIKLISNIFSHPERFTKDSLRSYYTTILKSTLEENELAFGVWVTYEPNKLDNMDALHKGKNNSTPNGCFSPYWTRKTGQIELSGSSDYEEGNPDYNFYFDTKKSLKLNLTEPYTDPDVKVRMASICYPIITNGSFVGVVGIDITLDKMNQIIKSIKPFKNSYAFIISDKGKIISHESSELIDKNIKEIEEFKSFDIVSDLTKQISANGNYRLEYSFNNDIKEIVAVPITLGDSRTNWNVVIVIPSGEILSEGLYFIYKIVAVLILFAFILMFVIHLVSKNISKPLISLANLANKISNGDFSSINK